MVYKAKAAIALFIFFSLASPVYGAETPVGLKPAFMTFARTQMDRLNATVGWGLAGQFFSAGDPNRLLPVVDRWLRGLLLILSTKASHFGRLLSE